MGLEGMDGSAVLSHSILGISACMSAGKVNSAFPSSPPLPSPVKHPSPAANQPISCCSQNKELQLFPHFPLLSAQQLSLSLSFFLFLATILEQSIIVYVWGGGGDIYGF